MRPFHVAHLHTSPNGTGLEFDQLDHRRALLPRLPVGGRRQPHEALGKNRGRTARVRIRQGGTGELARAQMTMMVAVGVEADLQRAQAVDPGQLRIDERNQMIPTLECLVVGVAPVPIHNLLKRPPINRFEQFGKDAIDKSHARLLLCLDTPQVSSCTDSAGHAPRHSESFPGQPCLKRGGGAPGRVLRRSRRADHARCLHLRRRANADRALWRHARPGARRRSRGACRSRRSSRATRASTGRSSTRSISAAPTRRARTTAMSRAWRCCSRGCRTVPGHHGQSALRLRPGRGRRGGARNPPGEIDLAIAGGVESMTRAPFVMGKAAEAFPAHAPRSTTPPSAGVSSIR